LLAIVSASTKPFSLRTSIVICSGYLLFTIGDYVAFFDYYEVRTQIISMIADIPLTELRSAKEQINIINLSKAIGPSPILWFSIFYGFLAMAMLTMLWFIPYLRRRKK